MCIAILFKEPHLIDDYVGTGCGFIGEKSIEVFLLKFASSKKKETMKNFTTDCIYDDGTVANSRYSLYQFFRKKCIFFNSFLPV